MLVPKVLGVSTESSTTLHHLGSLSIDDVWTNNTTDDAGLVVFDYEKSTYSLAFHLTYDSKGSPNLIQCSGHRSPLGSSSGTTDSSTVVSAKQKLPTATEPRPEDWTTKPGWQQAASIIGIFGGGIPLLLSMIGKAKKAAQERDKDKKAEALSDFRSMVQKFSHIQERMAEVAKAVETRAKLQERDPDRLTLGPLQPQITDTITSRVDSAILEAGGPSKTVDGKVLEAVGAAVKEVIGTAYQDKYTEKILQRFAAFDDVLDDQARGQAVQDVMQTSLGKEPMYSEPSEVPWVKDIVDQHLAQARAKEARDARDQAITLRDTVQSQLDAAAQKKRDIENQKELFEKTHPDDGKVMSQSDKDTLAEIERRLTALDAETVASQQALVDHKSDIAEAEKRENLEKDKETNAKNDKERHVNEAFHPVV